MKVFNLTGVVGFPQSWGGVEPSDVLSFLNEAAGEDVRIDINSPGGYVYDGIEIFNALRRYEGKVTARITGLAASIASYIALAAENVEAEDNAIYMIHNAWMVAGGDYRDFEKMSDILNRQTRMLAKKYESKTGMDSGTIKDLMDEESYFYGEEIKEFGFADSVIDLEDDEDAEPLAMKSLAKVKVKETFSKLKKEEDRSQKDFEKVAAYLKNNVQPLAKNNDLGLELDNTKKVKDKGGQMNLAELLKANPTAQAEMDQTIQTSIDKSKAEMSERFVYAKSFLVGDTYNEKIKEKALAYAEGSISKETLDAVVEVFDIQTESTNTNNVAADQVPETPAQEPQVQNDNTPKTAAEISEMHKRDKGV